MNSWVLAAVQVYPPPRDGGVIASDAIGNAAACVFVLPWHLLAFATKVQEFLATEKPTPQEA